MSNNDEVALRFADLWTAIRKSDTPDDMIDRIRDALDRKATTLAQQNPAFIENSFTLEAIAYETEVTQILRVVHRDLRISFAIKTVPEKMRDDAVLVQRLRREADIGLSMRHPCLQEISALLRLADGRPALVQPWMPVTLGSLLKSKKLAPHEINRALQRVLRATDALHQANYVHGDITPSNLLLPDGDINRARLTDFGITLKIGEFHHVHGVNYAGSHEFSAPEQMTGSAAHPTHDIYSLGKLAQRMLSALDGEEDEKLMTFVQLCTAEASRRPRSVADAALLLG